MFSEQRPFESPVFVEFGHRYVYESDPLSSNVL